MTIHYHGLPLTPEVMLLDLSGQHVCISYATKRPAQVEISLRLMQSIMFDNGAFSIHQQGGTLDVQGFYRWIAPMLGHPHWAVVPDVIGGECRTAARITKDMALPTGVRRACLASALADRISARACRYMAARLSRVERRILASRLPDMDEPNV